MEKTKVEPSAPIATSSGPSGQATESILGSPYKWHVNIDHYLNPYLPTPPWRWLPKTISHMLGHREHPIQIMGNVLMAFWSLIGCFCGVAVVASASMHIPSFQAHEAPMIVASFGAAAVLQFCAIESPLAQPRNAVLGQLIAAVIGTGITKLFDLNQSATAYPELAGALACGLTTAIMVLTHTVHPPAGATALVAVMSSNRLGWFLIPVMMLSCALMLATALLINNIQRRYPMYWWTAHDMRSKPMELVDEEASHGKRSVEAMPPSQFEEDVTDDIPRIVLQRGEMFVSEGVILTKEEREVLERICNKL